MSHRKQSLDDIVEALRTCIPADARHDVEKAMRALKRTRRRRSPRWPSSTATGSRGWRGCSTNRATRIRRDVDTWRGNA
jgi:hypothetical protein